MLLWGALKTNPGNDEARTRRAFGVILADQIDRATTSKFMPERPVDSEFLYGSVTLAYTQAYTVAW